MPAENAPPGAGPHRAPNPRFARASGARLAAVQFLYQTEFGTVPESDRQLRAFLHQRAQAATEPGEMPADPIDDLLLARIVRGVSHRRHDIDGILEACLTGQRDPAGLELLLRAILRAGILELLDHADVPGPVVVSEYVNVTHAFYGGREPALVNGILDHALRLLRDQEHGGGRRSPGAAGGPGAADRGGVQG